MAPVLSAGIPAYNEERRIARAILSLVGQKLPERWVWGEILVVASGCTDRTAEIAQATDPRVRVITQPAREGKSAALSVIIGHARGDALALLNADAKARPFSLERLLARLPSSSRSPSVVMARCAPPARTHQPVDRAIDLLWELHHQLYLQGSNSGNLRGVADEFLLLGPPFPSTLPPGIINDGGFIGGWIRRSQGSVIYEPAAEVEIRVPSTLRELVRQRRRIRFGHRRNSAELSITPMTWGSLARENPVSALRLLRAASRATKPGIGGWSCLVFAEFVSMVQSGRDALFGGVDHVRWPPARDAPEFVAETGNGS